MSDDQFMKLFNHIEKRFDEMDRRFDETASKKQVDELTNTVDGIAKDVEDLTLEATVGKCQYDRHEEWIGRASQKLNIDYDPAG